MSNNKTNDKTDELKKKLKFHENSLSRGLEVNKFANTRGLLPSSNNHQSNDVDVETYLLHPKNTFDKKNEITLDVDKSNSGKYYRNFTIGSENTRKNLDYSEYINNGFKGNGRGFGDYQIGSELRYGFNSRLEKNNTRQADVSNIKLNNSDLGLNDMGNNVLPFPRGGIDTRNLDRYRKEN